MTAGSGLFSTERGVNPAKTVAGKGGLPGEVGDLRRDIEKTFVPLLASTVQEFTNPILGTASSLLAAAATVAAPVTVLASALTGATLANMLGNPRQVMFTTAGTTPSDAPATATVTGKDPRGLPQVEAVAVAQTADSVLTTKFFSDVESISYSAGDGTDATVAIGVGAKLGLFYAPKARAGGALVLGEVSAGVTPTAGVVVPAGASDLPYGSYTPNSALNGILDFAIAYEYDPSV